MGDLMKCSSTLIQNYDKINQYVSDLKRNRDEITSIIKHQEQEKSELCLEIDRLTYKLYNINKGIATRMCARSRYDEAIEEAQEYHQQLVQSSSAILQAIKQDFKQLFETMDKKVGTDVV